MDKNELSRIREIPLEMVLESFGAERDPQDPKRNWRTAAGRITVTDTKYFNHDAQVGGGGAIDLTQHLGNYGFREALAYLGNIAGHAAAVKQYQVEGKKHAQKILDTTPAPKQEIPVPDASKLNRVRNYLTETRSIPEPIVEKAIAKGRLWADKFGNAVFALSDPGLSGAQVGAELRGTYEKPFHGVRGQQKGMFFTGNAKSGVAVFVESGIEALSYEAMNPNAMVVSTTGSTKEQLVKTAALLAERGFQLVAGFNNDKDGDRFSEWLNEAFQGVKREKPVEVKDWNDLLRQRIEKAREQGAPQAEEKQERSAPQVKRASKEQALER